MDRPYTRRLRVSPPLADPVAAASLVRAMALRAELAERAGDHRTAALWAAAVVELWTDARVLAAAGRANATTFEERGELA